jgi:hypothetical protein
MMKGIQMGVNGQKIFPFKKTKKQRISEQAQIIIDLFGGTLIKGGENEN